MGSKKADQDGPIIIKKYANRRLYNTDTSSYVTLDHLAELIKEDRDFKVVDAKSGNDITRSVLAQIIFDKESHESEGENMLPISFLKQLIGLYGQGIQKFVPNYLQTSLEALMENQQKLQSQFSQPEPLKMFEELTKKNMSLFTESMKMFTPNMGGDTEKKQAEPEAKKETPSSSKDGKIDALQQQLADLQEQISKLGK